MINFLSNWIEQITISVIIVSIFELILPNGSIKKYIKIVLGIYIVFSIISPFVDSKALYNIENAKVDAFIDNIEKESKTQINQKSMDTRLEELYLKQLEEDINKNVKEFGYEVYKCEIEADLKNSNKSAGIQKIKLVLEENTEKIGKIHEVNISINESYEESGKTAARGNEANENITESIKQSLAEHYDIPKDIILIKTK